MPAREGLSVEDFQYKYRKCDLCETHVTRRNWGVHVNTNKHQNNVKDGTTGKSSRSGAGGTPGSGRKKANTAALNGADEDVNTPPSKKRMVQTSPDGRLKRPSSIALKRDGVNGTRDATTPKSA